MDNKGNNKNDITSYPTPQEWAAQEKRAQQTLRDYASMNKNNQNVAKDFRDAVKPPGPRHPDGGPAPTMPPTMTAQASLGIHPPATEPQIITAPPLRFLNK